MDVNTLLVFLDVAKAGSLAEAARRTGIPRSTLSRRLEELETQLGVRLFQRTPRKLGLTEPGRQLVEHARRVADEVESARRVVQSRADTPRGTLRVASSVSLCEQLLTPILIRFLQRYPEVNMELFLEASFADLITEEIDVAIRARSPDPGNSTIAKRLATTALYLCATPTYLERAGSPATLADLADHDSIVYRNDIGPAVWVLEAPDGEVSRIAPKAKLTVNSYPVAREAALDGLGISLLPILFCRHELADGHLVRVLPDYRSPLRWVYVAFPSRESPSAALRVFVDFVQQNLDTHALLLPEREGE